jgi:hypothetical protein
MLKFNSKCDHKKQMLNPDTYLHFGQMLTPISRKKNVYPKVEIHEERLTVRFFSI